MNLRILLWVLSLCYAAVSAAEAPARFTFDQHFLVPPAGTTSLGDSHGDIAIAPSGEIYVSVEGGAHPGMQVYGRDGRYLRNLPGAPNDLHGFVIAAPTGESASIYAVRLRGEQIIRLSLAGQPLLTIPASSIPDQYKTSKDGKLSLALTGVAVAPDGDIYAVDGYGRDFIHRFDGRGQYKATFGGREAPWGFKTCHKIAIDSRFEPARLLCADRLNGRVVQMDLDGGVLGILAEGLRWPGALAIFKEELAVAELDGRVSLIDRQGRVAALGENNDPGKIKTNKVPPQEWTPNLFYAPHGITYDAGGNLLVAEWNQWGRVVRLTRNK